MTKKERQARDEHDAFWTQNYEAQLRNEKFTHKNLGIPFDEDAWEEHLCLFWNNNNPEARVHMLKHWTECIYRAHDAKKHGQSLRTMTSHLTKALAIAMESTHW